MINGHGDDAYRYTAIRANFSSNVYHWVNHDGLNRYLAGCLSCIRSYPEPEPYALAGELAQLYGVSPEEICVTNGATEAIYLIAQAFRGSHSAVWIPTFSEYADACRLHGHRVEGISSLEKLTDGEGIFWLCNPNNPTGQTWDVATLRRLIAAYPRKLFVIDQSYALFTEKEVLSVAETVKLPNVLLLHSMTKCYAVPGLRLGAVTGSRELLSRIRACRMPWSVNALAVEAGHYLLQHPEEYRMDIQALLAERKRVTDALEVFMVSEDGASVYSASAAAREEFPDYDVTVRGAVSIGRRLIDPLSELVKIDPKSIGVGQYQHSVDPAKLKARLRTVVESCVNRVGVNINTASKHILTYISGLGPVLAQNIVAYRAANGEFKSRRALLKVPRLGAKAFEQAAGFLRVVGGANPLDNSAVHPESYAVVERMAADAGVTVERLLADKQLRSGLKAERYVSGETGLPTVTDILEALDKRGLDPREQLQVFAFDPNVHTIGDLREGMLLPGIVTNITAFGAFVDIGVKQDGLVHISQLADRYVASPADVVHLGQHVEVRVTGVDAVRGRIALSMRREA